MAEVFREVEVKLSVADHAEVPSLVALGEAVYGGRLARGEPELLELSATYFDTAHLDLARHGLTLRRRVGGTDSGWHLKVPLGGSERSEVRLPLSGAVASQVPEPLQRLVQARTLGRHLVLVATIVTHRTVTRLLDTTGAAVLELADDQVSARRVLPSEGAGGAPGPEIVWREIEIEDLEGDAAAWTALMHGLHRSGLRVASHGSKLARVLEPELRAGDGSDARRKTEGRPTVKSPTRRVSMSYVRDQVEQVRAQDLLVRIDAPDAVHAMRVATRRIRSALATYHRVFAVHPTEPLRAELGWLAGILGAVRDAEVMRERVLGALQAAREDRTGDLGALEARTSLSRSYAEAREVLLLELDSERYTRLLQDLEVFVQAPPTTAYGERPAGKALRRAVSREYADVRRLVRSARSATAAEQREDLLHEARKAAKRARCAAEVAAKVHGRRALALAVAMETVQGLLGEHQDAVVLRGRLLELSEATTDPMAAFTYGRLYAREEARAREVEARLPSVWEAASRKRLRRWLK